MRNLSLAVIALAGIAVSGTAAAADAKLVQSCNDCHGNNGLTQWQDVPSIAGISAGVITDAIAAYKAKEAPCPKMSYKQGDTKRPQTDMCAVAGTLSDAQVKDLAAHYSKLPAKPMKQSFDAAKAAKGKAIHMKDCDGCHSDAGRSADDDASIIGGQPLNYIKTALADVKAGKRQVEKKMKDKVAKLSDADFDALANFYASQQ